MKRKFPYGQTKRYRAILDKVFGGDATDDQLNTMSLLILDVADDEFATHCRRIDEADAMEWLGRAVAIARGVT